MQAQHAKDDEGVTLGCEWMELMLLPPPAAVQAEALVSLEANRVAKKIDWKVAGLLHLYLRPAGTV